MDEDSTSERLDQVEAWMVRARATMDGIATELRVDGRSRRLRRRMDALRAEFEAQKRALDELPEDADE